MNLLETYVSDISNVEKIHRKESGIEYDVISITATFNCYGVIEKTTKLIMPEEYEQIKTKGYYLC